MRNDPVDLTLTHIQEITGNSPRLKDLFKVRELWLRLQKYWGLLSEETLRRRANSDTIRVVDFDIIYPAFWQSAGSRPATHRPTTLESRFGFPMTTDFVFRHTQRPFTIPSGALFEVARHLMRLEQSYRTSNSKLAQIVANVESEVATSSHNVAQYALAVSREIGPEVEREVDELIEMGVRLRSLKSILDHPFYRPWQDVVDKAGLQVDPDKVLRVRSLFNVIRPHRKLSNYLDALNVASYHTLLARRDIESQFTDVFPVMASGTRMILQYPTSTGAGGPFRSVTLTEDAIQPVSTQYLSFATAAEVYAENNLMLLASITKENRSELFNLLGLWDTFWFEWGSTFHNQTRNEIEETELESLANVLSFRELCAGYSKWKSNFMDIIGQTFIQITRTDRRLSENFKLIRERLVGSLKRGKYDSNLIDYGELTAFTWNQKAASVDSHLLIQHELGEVGKSNQEITLQALKSTGILQEKKFVLARRTPTLHIDVNFLHINDTVFSWERKVGSASQLVTWGYSRNLEDTLGFIKDLLGLNYVSSEIKVSIFGEGVYERKALNLSLSVESLFSEIISVTTNPDYLRIEADAWTVFCDIAPAFENGYSEIAVLYSDQRLNFPIAEFHHETANSTLAPSLIKGLLRRYSSTFREREEAMINALEKYDQSSVEVEFE